ncbi:MAG: MBL fold metallo-hydrolase [Desulfobulbaceae bacterium]|nr:MBL fold metallo-hydrolase [Desulfobulbaceae bacterium]
MRFCVLASGSKGNSTYLETGSTRILIDAGLSGKEIERRLAAIQIDPASLSAIIVTHEHHDHICGVGVLSRRFQLPVFANEATLLAGGKTLQKLSQWQPFVTGDIFSFQDVSIHPFLISHDAADPVGFCIEDGNHSLGYCTDTGKISHLMHHRLSRCQGLILESNHDPVMLQSGPYPEYLKQRVRSNVGHLPNHEAAQFIDSLKHEHLRHVVLAHISDTNNHPDLVWAAVRGAMPDNMPNISLACQEQVGEVVSLVVGED